MMRFFPLLALVLSLPSPTPAPSAGIIGHWREPTGSVIDVTSCGTSVCARLIAISQQAPTQLDIHNPDISQRTRKLCGLQIGTGFHLANPARAEGGKLYDPKTGKTYSGSMTSTGDQLQLRGYIGISAFGRSQTWTRVTTPTPICPR